MKTAKKELSPALLLWAAVFLLNPNINLLDLLPDCIGYLLLVRALSGIDELVPHFDAARAGFLRLFWVALSKIPAYFVMAALVGDSTDHRVTITLLALSYGIMEVLFSFFAIAELFAGVDYLRARHGLFVKNGHLLDNARLSSYIWAIAKPALAFLPELCYLSMYEHFGFVTNAPDIVVYRPMFVAIAFLVGLGFGIYFLVAVSRGIAAARDEEGLFPLLCGIRSKNLPPLHSMARIRRIRAALSLLAIGFVALIDLVFDEINYLPNGVAILFFAVAAFLLLPYAKRGAIAVLIVCVPTLAFSTIASVLRFSFFAQYNYAALGKWLAADTLYRSYELFSTLEAAAQVLLFSAMLFLLICLIRTETGFIAENAENRQSHKELHRALTFRVSVLCGLGALSSIAMAADVYLRYFTDNYKQGTPMGDDVTIQLNGVALPIYGWFWLIVLLLRIVSTFVAVHTAAILSGEVEHKYMLD